MMLCQLRVSELSRIKHRFYLGNVRLNLSVVYIRELVSKEILDFECDFGYSEQSFCENRGLLFLGDIQSVYFRIDDIRI